jgi:hypothetical protein
MMRLDGEPWTPPAIIYQKMAGRYAKWFCRIHNRPADHICLSLGTKHVTVTCDPKLGGIMIPCQCELDMGEDRRGG